MLIVAYFSVAGFVSLLVWIGLAAMAFWVWSGTKAKSTLMTMIGAALLALFSFVVAFGIFSFDAIWFYMIGAGVVAAGYYYTVKPVVDARVKELKEKASKMTSSGSSGSTPPAAPPPAK